MFSEKIRPTTAIDDIIRFVRMDDNRVIFETYQSLQVCDWDFSSQMMASHLCKGLLHYESVILFLRATRVKIRMVYGVFTGFG